MDAALEGPHPDSGSGDDRIIDRPDAEKLFEDLLRSCPSEYSVLVGNRGTGKSTLATKVARKTQGVLYVTAPAAWACRDSKESPVVDVLDSALRAALGWRGPATLWFFADLLQPNSKRILILCSLCHILINFCPDRFPKNGFRRTMLDFELAAARYKAKHGSCAVLVIDNINTKNCDLPLLQGIAKQAADRRLYKVIFVADGNASAAMKRESG